MEDIGSWVYIVAIVGAAIVSLFKKKPKEESTIGPQIPFPDDVDDEPWTLSQAPPPVIVKKEMPHKAMPIEGARVFSTLPGMASTVPVSIFERVEEEVFDFSFDAQDTDELKRGLIYSEILNRKY